MNVSCMSRVVTTYCTSCWIPAVVHVVSFIAAYLAIICLCLYKLSKSMPGEITWPVTIVLIIWAVIAVAVMAGGTIANEVEAVVNILKWGSVTTDDVDFTWEKYAVESCLDIICHNNILLS